MSARQRSPLVLASVPLWPIAWLHVLAILVRVKLGYWPSYGHPDAGSLTWPWVVLDIAVLPLLILAPLAVAGSVAPAIHAWYTRRWDWRLLLTAASFAVFVAWLRFDPGGLFNWWAD